jgi:DNA-binding transcriptional regulator GbsR (MarR family)
MKDFETVCVACEKAAEMKRFAEMVYDVLAAKGGEMTATEIRDALPARYSRQRVTAYLRKLIVMGAVERREVATGEKVTITPCANPYYQPRRMCFKEVFDAQGKSLDEQCVYERLSEPFEVEVKVAYFKAV